MNTVKWLGILVSLGVLWTTSTRGDSEIDEHGLSDCVEDLQLPRGGPSGKPGDKIGPLSVTIVPDTQGRPKSVTIDPASDPAAVLTRSWISGSTFSRTCAGQAIALQFSFWVEGPPIEYPFSWVSFQSPNHFIIHSRARIPSLFRSPDSPGTAKDKKR